MTEKLITKKPNNTKLTAEKYIGNTAQVVLLSNIKSNLQQCDDYIHITANTKNKSPATARKVNYVAVAASIIREKQNITSDAV
jgi:hypothetical protein